LQIIVEEFVKSNILLQILIQLLDVVYRFKIQKNLFQIAKKVTWCWRQQTASVRADFAAICLSKMAKERQLRVLNINYDVLPQMWKRIWEQ